VTGSWRKLHDGELHSACVLRNIRPVRKVKLTTVRWAGHNGRDRLEDLGVDRIILK
jgi:hypothetical protein